VADKDKRTINEKVKTGKKDWRRLATKSHTWHFAWITTMDAFIPEKSVVGDQI
jgi:hypothetical protein